MQHQDMEAVVPVALQMLQLLKLAAQELRE
jgi:hypothetical protein